MCTRVPLVLISLLLHLCSAELDGWRTVEIPCNFSNWKPFISQEKTEVVFADCGNKTHFVSQPLNMSEVTDLRVTGRMASVVDCGHNTGIGFEGIENLHLKNLQIRNCYDTQLEGSISVVNCTNVSIKNITIENSNGTGLVLNHNMGEILIENCTLQHNGLYYTEKRSRHPSSSDLDTTYRYKGGGGLKVLIEEKSLNVTIKDCNFFNNSAFSGGGMLVVINFRGDGSTVLIQNNHFIGNKCDKGGGGLRIGYNLDDRPGWKKIKKNGISIQNCTFFQNKAVYGGGTAVFSVLGPPRFSDKSKIKFVHCLWTNNTAKLGMAVDISIAPWKTLTRAGLFPSPVLKNCVFSQHNYTQSPRSVLSVVGFSLKFQEKTVFIDNNVTAIEATSAVLKFGKNSTTRFVNNKGIHGGAMRLKGSTVMFIQANSAFLFKGNKASVSGGAIYVESFDAHSILSSKSCFIQYKGGQEPHNVSFVFANNRAGITNDNENIYGGDSVYTTTLRPCLESCTKNLTNVLIPVTEALRCIGDFTFDKIELRRKISTAADHFSHIKTRKRNDTMCSLIVSNGKIGKNLKYDSQTDHPIINRLPFIPGKMKKLPLKLVDELCGKVPFHVSVTVLESKQNTISVNSAHSIITDNHVALFGDPQDSGTIQLSAVGLRDVSVQIEVRMEGCPPGYIHISDHTKKCICYLNVKNHPTGIERCNETEFQAYVKHGYWVGYIDSSLFNKSRLLTTAICPKGFCVSNAFDNLREHPLPAESGVKDLSPYICNFERRGVLCGRCSEKHSAYYRSTSFSCKSDALCNWGWVFYILSELVPITILFLVVILLNISFTSGSLNGVVFFMQVVDTLKMDAENFIHLGGLSNVTKIYKIIYRIFTLNIFAIEDCSFCLWKHASALDMLAFRYVTILYSLFLVLSTATFLKMCNFRCIQEKLNLKHSIIHGLSAFLVMSYSECTRVSLLILTVGTLRTIPDTPDEIKVSFYNGDYSYMGPEHLKYAFPAIFFILTMVSIPPLLLLSYPLCYKLFALLRIEESRFVQITCKIFPLEKIKPLFDSIQGTFKDRYRFFAGMYFLYRLGLLLTFTYTSTLPLYYTITGAQLVCMLVLHAVCQPYKKAWHNILDALLFSILAFINFVTFYNYQILSDYTNSETVKKLVGTQIGFVLLPLVYLVVYTVHNIVKRIKAACVHKSTYRDHEENDNSNEVINSLETRYLDDSVMEMSNYRLLPPERK